MEKLKLQIEILKIKITFFSALTGGVSFLFINIDKLEKFFNITLLCTIFAIACFYTLLGVFINLTYLNDKYKELQNDNIN